MSKAPENSGKKQAGRFQPGQSGNPRGKPKGTRHRAIAALDKVGDESAEAIVKATIKAAIDGDMAAARVLLDRVWPARKGRPVALDLPSMADAGGVVRAIARIAEATAAGEITPDEAQSYAAIIEAQRRAIETHELESRVANLEERMSRK